MGEAVAGKTRAERNPFTGQWNQGVPPFIQGPGIMGGMTMIPGTPLPPGPWNVLGLMSGTSADGTDAAMIRVDPRAFGNGTPFLDFLGHCFLPYPEDLREQVLAAAADLLKPSALCILQRRLGECHAEAGRTLTQNLSLQPHLACLHGQTVQHHPNQGATLQLADPYLLSETLGCPVVWDLRRRDMALGGQGAPLVPMAEVWLHGQSQPWAALNLGGIANITLWSGTRLQAWDLGPAMSLLDLAAQRWLGLPFDPEGEHAHGPASTRLVDRWMEHPHFQKTPPKSQGREVFGPQWLEREAPALAALPVEERLATLAAFTAEACARELSRFGEALPVNSPLWISGGGTRHLPLRRELIQRLSHFRVEVDRSFPSGAREAISWALLGAASAVGMPGNFPEVTGAGRSAILGSWT